MSTQQLTYRTAWIKITLENNTIPEIKTTLDNNKTL